MTETDLRYADLPAPVRSSYESSTYYNVWKVEDVDKLERKEMAVVYIIEVEKGNQEMDLYYSEDGILVKEVLMRTTAVLPKIISLLIFPPPSRIL